MKHYLCLLLLAVACVLVFQARAAAVADAAHHSADSDSSGGINLSELLRVIQYHENGGYHCADTVDGYAPGAGDTTCGPHDADYAPQDWTISEAEVYRMVDYYNAARYSVCEEEADGFCIYGVLADTTKLTVDETGTGTYTLRLPSMPTDRVTVYINSNNPLVSGPRYVIFDADVSALIPRTVTVKAGYDPAQADFGATLSHELASHDPNYNGGHTPSVAVMVEDLTRYHSADANHDFKFDLVELLRVIQFYNSGEFHCAADTEDGYDPGPGNHDCAPPDTDYRPQDWRVGLAEMLRIIQLYNSNGFYPCASGEDGFCPGI